jgi:peptide chain release factor 1
LGAALLRFATPAAKRIELGETARGYVSFFVRGAAIVQRLQWESGLHCVQRVPRTERGGRRHTSFVRVTVTAVPSGPVELRLADVEETFQRGHGKGGQNQNRVSSAVRMRHVPTGLAVFINGRDQGANRDRALRILSERVREHRAAAAHDAWASAKASQGGTKIRTYNLLENRAVDHRTGRKVFDVVAVLKGRFDLLS